jgi:hypothetical protein
VSHSKVNLVSRSLQVCDAECLPETCHHSRLEGRPRPGKHSMSQTCSNVYSVKVPKAPYVPTRYPKPTIQTSKLLEKHTPTAVAVRPYTKSSYISLTKLYFGLATSSSSSTYTFKPYKRATFSALRASVSSRSAFSARLKGLR